MRANDAAAVAALSELRPAFALSTRDPPQVRSKAYAELFPAKVRACVQRGKAVYDRTPSGIESYSIFCGQSIFVFARQPAGFLLTDIGVDD